MVFKLVVLAAATMVLLAVVVVMKKWGRRSRTGELDRSVDVYRSIANQRLPDTNQGLRSLRVCV